MAKNPGLWSSSFGSIVQTLTVLEKHGVTPEQLAEIRTSDFCAKEVARVIMHGGQPSLWNLAIPLRVDYERTIEEARSLVEYFFVAPGFNSENFPTKRTGTADITLHLKASSGYESTEEAIERLDRLGQRPAELRELLALTLQLPEECWLPRCTFRIVALGSVLKNFSVPVVESIFKRRDLALHSLEGHWGHDCYIAGVAK